MIDKNNLRLGNLVVLAHESNAPIAEIVELHKKYAVVRLYPTQLEQRPIYGLLLPIDLSEYWLERIGFKKDGFNTWNICISPWPESHLKQLSVSQDYIFIREGKKDYPRVDDDIVVIWNNDTNGKPPIHFIQNSYNLLTGKELTIKEPING